MQSFGIDLGGSNKSQSNVAGSKEIDKSDVNQDLVGSMQNN